MSKAKERWNVVTLKDADYSYAAIKRKTGHDRHYVDKWYQRATEEGHVDDRPRSGLPATTLTPRGKRAITRRMKERLGASARKAAKELKQQGFPMSKSSVNRYTKTQEWGHPYKRTVTGRLTETQRLERLRFARLYDDGDEKYWRNVIFSDEKNFHLNPVRNSQNDRYYTSDPFSVPPLKYSKGDVRWMVWGAISYTGRSKLHFVPQGTSVDSAYYQREMIEGTLLPALGHELGPDSWELIFQQDKATPHTSKSTQRFLERKLPGGFFRKDEWLVKGYDVSPSENVWGIMDNLLLDKEFRTLAQLKQTVRWAWNKVPQATIQRIYDALPGRIHSIKRSRGRLVHPHQKV